MVMPWARSRVRSSRTCWYTTSETMPMAIAMIRPIARTLSLVSSPTRTGCTVSGEVVAAVSGEVDRGMVRSRGVGFMKCCRWPCRRRRRGLGDSGGRHRYLPNPLPPLARPAFVHRRAASVHRDRHRHVLDLEFVDRFHAEVGERDGARTLDRLGYQIGRAADRHQVRGAMLADRVDRDGPALGFAYHDEQTRLRQHHFRELV